MKLREVKSVAEGHRAGICTQAVCFLFTAPCPSSDLKCRKHTSITTVSARTCWGMFEKSQELGGGQCERSRMGEWAELRSEESQGQIAKDGLFIEYPSRGKDHSLRHPRKEKQTVGS